MNELLVIGAVVAFVGAVASFALVRQRDFVTGYGGGAGDGPSAGAPGEQAGDPSAPGAPADSAPAVA